VPATRRAVKRRQHSPGELQVQVNFLSSPVGAEGLALRSEAFAFSTAIYLHEFNSGATMIALKIVRLLSTQGTNGTHSTPK
jgi:hypothetical protein